MPVPSKERVTELVSGLVQSHGYDLEDVVVTLAGKHSAVRVIVDSDAGLELDAVAALSREISAVFDDVSDFGESPYTLEVTSPGIERPLTLERHWHRARGRLARFAASIVAARFHGRCKHGPIHRRLPVRRRPDRGLGTAVPGRPLPLPRLPQASRRPFPRLRDIS